jgi:carbon monoxide dehydrogenase subunit G
MKFEGRVEIHAPRPKVWASVTDPDQIARCVPGVQSIEKLDGGRFKVHAKVSVGFISSKLVVDAEFTEIHEPDDATVLARGQASGSAVDATAKIVLTDGTDGSTVIDWTADVTMSGMIASVGAGLIDGPATKMVGQTFDCIKAKLEA